MIDSNWEVTKNTILALINKYKIIIYTIILI